MTIIRQQNEFYVFAPSFIIFWLPPVLCQLNIEFGLHELCVTLQAASDGPSTKRTKKSTSEEVDVETEAKNGNVCSCQQISVHMLLTQVVVSLYTVAEDDCACSQGIPEESWY